MAGQTGNSYTRPPVCDQVWQYLLICSAETVACVQAFTALTAEGVMDDKDQLVAQNAMHSLRNCLNELIQKKRGISDKAFAAKYKLTPVEY